MFQLAWLGDRLTGIWQLFFPSGTLTKRYISTDETNRPLEMWAFPSTGDSRRVWAVNPSAWGFDTNLVGPSVFQPILFAGQYKDTETAAYLNDGTTVHRPGLALNGFRTYDAFTGSYLQVDPLAPETRSSYGYPSSWRLARHRAPRRETSPLRRRLLRAALRGMLFPEWSSMRKESRLQELVSPSTRGQGSRAMWIQTLRCVDDSRESPCGYGSPDHRV